MRAGNAGSCGTFSRYRMVITMFFSVAILEMYHNYRHSLRAFKAGIGHKGVGSRGKKGKHNANAAQMQMQEIKNRFLAVTFALQFAAFSTCESVIRKLQQFAYPFVLLM